MKIGFITTSFPRSHRDSAGSFVFGMAAALRDRGHLITVLAPAPGKTVGVTKDPMWPEGMELVHVPDAWPKHRGNLFYGAGVPDNIRRQPMLTAQIPMAMLHFFRQVKARRHRFDAVVSHWLLPSALIAGPSRQSGTPHLAISHSSDMHLLTRLPFARLWARAISDSATHLGFVTNRLKEEFLGLFSHNTRKVIARRTSTTPMGIHPADLRCSRERGEIRKELELNLFTVLCLGRLVPIKGVDILLRAVRRAGNLELLVAGDGPERFALERRAKEWGLRARFLGRVSPQRRAELLKAADVVAVPSRQLRSGRKEGRPMVIVEALAAGCPVVASAVADSERFLEAEECGSVVAPKSRSLRDALCALRDNPLQRAHFSKRGMAFADQLDWKNLAARYEHLLETKHLSLENRSAD